MGSDSDESEKGDNMEWSEVESMKRKRKKRKELAKNVEMNASQVEEIIGIPQSQQSNYQNIQKAAEDKNKQTNSTTTDKLNSAETMNAVNHLQKNKHRNYSPKMNVLVSKPFNNLFYINAGDINRIQMAELWENERPNSKDVILQTKKGFLLKSDTPKAILFNFLTKLKKNKSIEDFLETQENKQQKNININKREESYSAIISQVERIIEDEVLSKFLKDNGIDHRYCKRIVSRATGKQTLLIRIITGNIDAYEKLINEGVFYKNRHYPVFESLPPTPAPLPCARCLQFSHRLKTVPQP